MGYIYKITNNINGKVYIGKTDFTVESRWKNHLHDWKTKIEYEQRPLYNAFSKYGVENFAISQIEKVDDNDLLSEREQYWINYYRSYVGFPDCNGYNATLGGDGRSWFNHSDEEVIAKYKELKTIRATAKYFNCDFDTISNRLKRNNIDPTSLENKRNFAGKRVQALDFNDNVIKEFNSQTAAAEWLIEVSQLSGSVNTTAANIGRCCNGIRQSYGGYKWKRI